MINQIFEIIVLVSFLSAFSLFIAASIVHDEMPFDNTTIINDFRGVVLPLMASAYGVSIVFVIFATLTIIRYKT